MPWYATIGQRVDTSANGWTAAGGPRPDPSPYLAAEGFTMEDWNLARADTIPNPLEDGDGRPVLLGFGQGRVASSRRARATRERGGPRFDLCLFTWEGGRCLVHAVYLDARYIDDDEAAQIRRDPAWVAVRARREHELRALYPADADARIRSFRRDHGVRWMVSPDRLVVLNPPVQVAPPGDARRYSNALNWSARPWWGWVGLGADPAPIDDDLPSTVEGRVVVVRHQTRERDASFIAKVKARRLAIQGAARCECCGLVMARVYGKDLHGFIEGHHTRPVGSLSSVGEAVRDEDIALLCPTCHRVAHRTGRLALDELRQLLPDGWTFPMPPMGRP